MNAIVLLLLCLNPVETVLEDRVDVVEVNHFYDEQGREVFTQDVFYDWHPCRERHQVRAWRLWKSTAQTPERDWQRGGYVVTWQDGEIVRRVRAASIRESWTQYDPELAERCIFPKDKRRELSK